MTQVAPSPLSPATSPFTQEVANEPVKKSRAELIKECKEKYPKEFKIGKIKTLAIAIGALALSLIPLIASGLAALSLCSFGVGVLVVTPIAILGIGILIKKIDDITLYWSADLAGIILENKRKKNSRRQKKPLKKLRKMKKPMKVKRSRKMKS